MDFMALNIWCLPTSLFLLYSSFFAHRRVNLFVLFGPSIEWKRVTHINEDNLSEQ